MLVLSRKKGEKIVLGSKGEIVLEVVEINGNHIRLGITAPKEMPVFRQEIWEQMKEDKKERRS